ncbi:MAG: glycogen debranching protein GlgX [Myxococcaceae bacterium]|nr:glycogen debranching protein GlgX [Myxococcaceae bacterium]MCI0671469.1 glycogen debranching protein GlgX [Myxococcaceae bacterium]
MAKFALWEVWPGRPYPLGATEDGRGVNFAVFSEHARAVEVCFFDAEDPRRETGRVKLLERTGHVWHGYVPGLTAGTLYGLRAHGPYEPARGLRFNPAKLLMDPYARAITGKVDVHGPVFGYVRGGTEEDLTPDAQDSAPAMPRAVVLREGFDWGEDRRPRTPWQQSVIYELHVRGFTRKHPDVPPELRGTYTALGHPAVLAHLKRLGVTAVELLPVHEHVDDTFLVERGLTNYWGYSTLGYFAPEQRYAAGGSRGEQVVEFKQMVRALHAAGIEVLLDVVFNHSCEGNHLGPTLFFKSLDNTAYYWLNPAEPRFFQDFTGTGSSLNLQHPHVLQLVMDSLRYWVQEMHVDGFRFDLATTLGRTGEGTYDRNAPFFQAVHQDPVLKDVKLIAEPWDVGMGGYQVGNFPVDWAEWNGKYRDTMRKYWRGDDRQAAELGYRLTGSSDLFLLGGRKPFHSVNFITAHDGFTLHDLVTYTQKHNAANQEGNRDGTDENLSWNCGVEGETDDVRVLTLREQQKRNLVATLFLSQGVPMLVAGDEMGRTQRGNNNAYCQDNDLSWVNWALDERGKALLDFAARMSGLRREQPVLQRRRFFRGSQIWDSHLKDLAWFRPDGREMTREDWAKPYVRSLGFLLGGDAIATPGEQGQRIVGDTLLALLNAHHEPILFHLPAIEWGADWEVIVDTAADHSTARHTPAGGRVEVMGRSLIVLRRPATEEDLP